MEPPLLLYNRRLGGRSVISRLWIFSWLLDYFPRSSILESLLVWRGRPLRYLREDKKNLRNFRLFDVQISLSCFYNEEESSIDTLWTSTISSVRLCTTIEANITKSTISLIVLIDLISVTSRHVTILPSLNNWRREHPSLLQIRRHVLSMRSLSINMAWKSRDVVEKRPRSWEKTQLPLLADVHAYDRTNRRPLTTRY